MRAGARDLIGVTDAHALRSGKGIADSLIIAGFVVAELYDEHGVLKQREQAHNLITTVGRNQIVEQLVASPAAATKPTHMGVGTGAVAPTVGDTTMTSEVRVALTSKTRATNVLTMVGDWAAGSATQANTEAGIWDAASAGNLLSRATFSAIAKGASDTLKTTWSWTIG
jgi:hypothetical protein